MAGRRRRSRTATAAGAPGAGRTRPGRSSGRRVSILRSRALPEPAPTTSRHQRRARTYDGRVKQHVEDSARRAGVAAGILATTPRSVKDAALNAAADALVAATDRILDAN